MRYTFADAVERDLDDIVAFYSRDNPNAAARFVVEVRRVVTLLLEHPLAGERIDEAHRHYPLHRFPFYVNYGVDKDANCIRVVAVSDQRRRPGYWHDRIEEPAAVYAVPLAA